ncbi:MAG: DNA-processing protein DprA [Candidatus Saccharimonadales bacterium]
MNVNTLKLIDQDFPEILSQIPSPPQQIYWIGKHPKHWLDKPRVAVVGSRKMTAYGKTITDSFVTELARAGVVIVSGLALGIDITAHRAALAAGGETVAVLGSAIDQITPASHANVARQIVSQGTIISEYPPGVPTQAYNFVIRNRIIAGLAEVVVIPEAALKSGSLHTARFALEQGKTVMAVPGNINGPTSEGCNNLIKSGAVPVTNTSDIFFALKFNPAKQISTHKFVGTAQEQTIFELIEQGIAAQEELATASEMDGSVLSSTLTMLELSGYIRPAGGGNWILA